MTRALVIGATGQDGSYLVEELAARGQHVTATYRPVYMGGEGLRISVPDGPGVIEWRALDLRDSTIGQVIQAARPDVVYNLAALTTPGAGWATPPPYPYVDMADVAEVNALGALRLLQAVERHAPQARIVHASSSAIYDPGRYGPYGASKAFAHQAVTGFRERGLWAANAVLFSHTSPRQDPRFLVPTICREVTALGGPADRIMINSPGSRRDWMHARDAMRAMIAIAEHGAPADYDVGRGGHVSVRAVVGMALASARIGWDTRHVIADGGDPAVVERRADIGPLLALGWKPETSLWDTVAEMVEAANVERSAELREAK